MNVHFPLCKEEEVTHASFLIASPFYVCLNVSTDSGGMTSYTAKEQILKTCKGIDTLKKITTSTTGDSIEKIINLYFEKFDGNVDYLSYYCTLTQQPVTTYENPEALPKLKAAIAGRPISVTLLHETDCMFPNSPIVKFLREHIDYKMFACEMREGHSLELTSKMTNAEFLCLKCAVSNPEKLKEFSGWGLVLEDSEAKGFDSDYFYRVFEDWFSGKSIQYRYLGLECEVDMDKWETLCSRGIEKVYEEGFKHVEITRADGNSCGLKYDEYYIDNRRKTKIIFFLGERTLELDFFHMDWIPKPLINSGY